MEKSGDPIGLARLRRETGKVMQLSAFERGFPAFQAQRVDAARCCCLMSFGREGLNTAKLSFLEIPRAPELRPLFLLTCLLASSAHRLIYQPQHHPLQTVTSAPQLSLKVRFNIEREESRTATT